MQTPSRARARKQLIFSVALLAVAIAGYLVTRNLAPQVPQAENATSTVSTTTQQATTTTSSPSGPTGIATTPSGNEAVEGEYACLPKRATGGPQTLECALGIKADDGSYYALVSAGANSYSASATTPTGVRVRATGTVVPVAASSDSRWQTYDIVGIVQVVTFEQV